MMRGEGITVACLRLLLVLADTCTAKEHSNEITVPNKLPRRPLAADVMGFSIEPVSVDAYIGSTVASNLLSEVAKLVGKPVPVRVGGTTSDQTILVPSLPDGHVSQLVQEPRKELRWLVTPAWFTAWGRYFPPGTQLTYTLNFRNGTDGWANALAQAEAAHKGLGEALELLEAGNEVDHYVGKRWRLPGWGVVPYVEQFRNMADKIRTAPWYTALEAAPRFQAASFAVPPGIPSEHSTSNNFDIANLTTFGGMTEPAKDGVDVMSVHLYFQSTCNAHSVSELRLDLLTNHTRLWLNVSQYAPEVAAAERVGSSLIMGETNSAACSGRSGISDTFGAALWAVDYVLMAASIGLRQVIFHMGHASEYSAFVPGPHHVRKQPLEGGVRATWYAHWFIANVLAGHRDDAPYEVAALPSANSSDLSGYAVYRGDELAKLVVLQMGVWNGTTGLGNPSTLHSTDGTIFSKGERPVHRMRMTTGWKVGDDVDLLRLSAPGTNAKSDVHVAGVSFDAAGKIQGEQKAERLKVGENGVLNFDMVQAEAVLLNCVR